MLTMLLPNNNVPINLSERRFILFNFLAFLSPCFSFSNKMERDTAVTAVSEPEKKKESNNKNNKIKREIIIWNSLRNVWKYIPDVPIHSTIGVPCDKAVRYKNPP